MHVAPEQAQARIDAALAAGGTLVSDSAAPSFTVIADAEGNKACVCTWQPPRPRATMRDRGPACWDGWETRLTDVEADGYRGRMRTLVRTRRED